MEETRNVLEQADDILSKLTDVRIVYLPPSYVAASHYIGPEAERHAGAAMEQFIHDVKLWEIKPDIRSYGFNHPNQVKGTDYHGYEFWVTIPEGLEVPPPLTKKHFPGGLYAAHMIPMGNFHEWEWLWRWVNTHPEYSFNTLNDDGEYMGGCLEECLNYPNVVRNKDISSDDSKIQLDLLLPIKQK